MGILGGDSNIIVSVLILSLICSLPSCGKGEGCQCHSTVGVPGMALKNTHHYTIYYSAFSPELFKIVDESTIVVPSTRMSDIVVIRELTAGVEHQFQVTSSLEVQGEVYESGEIHSDQDSKIYRTHYMYSSRPGNYLALL